MREEIGFAVRSGGWKLGIPVQEQQSGRIIKCKNWRELKEVEPRGKRIDNKKITLERRGEVREKWERFLIKCRVGTSLLSRPSRDIVNFIRVSDYKRKP